MSFFFSTFAHFCAHMYKLSIITINRNNATGLRKTMESVFSQTYRDFEYIVVDGASDDGSVEVVKEFEQKISPSLQGEDGVGFFTWISEPDNGIYNAMNKGIEIALGRLIVNAHNRSVLSGVENSDCAEGYVLMLNSGDYLVDEHVVERIVPILDGTDVIQGNNIEERDGKKCRNRGCCKSEIDIFDILKGRFLHQASFCRKELFRRFGYFDESYQSSADTKFFMVCLGRYDATFKHVDIDITNYDLTGISANNSYKWVRCRDEEFSRIIDEVFSKRIYLFMLENDKKIRLYNTLHGHKLIWYLTMLLARVSSLISGKTKDD